MVEKAASSPCKVSDDVAGAAGVRDAPKFMPNGSDPDDACGANGSKPPPLALAPCAWTAAKGSVPVGAVLPNPKGSLGKPAGSFMSNPPPKGSL
eukprot:768537-Hanusia_phi.AAC.10